MGERRSGWLTALSCDYPTDPCRHSTCTESGASVGVDRVQFCGVGFAPRVRTRPVSPPDPSQVLDLIDEAQKLDPDMACFLLLAATTGARRGELCALRWTDIDLDLGTALIARSLVEGRGSELVEKDTKTHAPRRVALDKASIDELARHHEQCRHRAAACGSALRKSAHVFSLDPVGLRPWVPNEVTKRFIRIRKSVGLESARSSSS
jgi:integrase